MESFLKYLLSVILYGVLTGLNKGAFYYCSSLASINVSENNTTFSSVDGILYDKEQTRIIKVPLAISGSITIPDGVTRIDEGAFRDCSSLTGVTIGNGVTSIGDYAFYYCSSLTNINVSENNTTFSSVDGILYDKEQTKIIKVPLAISGSITIPDSVTSIGSGTFSGCSSLTSIEIPDSVTSIDEGAFRGCSSLTGVTIGNGVTSIGDVAFRACSGLTSITIPDSVTSIGRDAFRECSSLTSVTIPDGVTSIGDRAFSGCPIENAKIPAFASSYIVKFEGRENESLKNLEITSGSDIAAQSFSRCRSLTSVVIGNSVTSIGEEAFLCCYSLTSVVIGNSVTSIGDSAFEYCSSLTSITFNGTVEQWNAIEKGYYWNGDWNGNIPATKVVCSDGEVALS